MKTWYPGSILLTASMILSLNPPAMSQTVTANTRDQIADTFLNNGVSDETAMKQLLTLGIDRIYTDYPQRLLAIQREFRRTTRKENRDE